MAFGGCDKQLFLYFSSWVNSEGTLVLQNAAAPEGHKPHEANAEYQCLLCRKCTSYVQLTHMPQNAAMNQNTWCNHYSLFCWDICDEVTNANVRHPLMLLNGHHA